MDEGFLWFLLGALVSIPISVFAPFATKKVEQQSARRNVDRAAVRGKQLADEFVKIRALAQDRSLLTSYLVGRILVITVISFVGTLFSGVCYSAGSMLYALIPTTSDNYSRVTSWWAVANTLGSLCNILTVAIALPIGLRALHVRRRVNNFEKYEELTNAQLAEIGRDSVKAELQRRSDHLP